MCVIIGFVDAVLDQRPHTELLTEILTQPRAVVASVSGENLQLVRLPAGELLADLGVTPLSGRRAVQIKDHVCLCIDELRCFEVASLHR